MSSKHGDEDNDYDFFDSPRQNRVSNNANSAESKKRRDIDMSNHKSRPGKSSGTEGSTNLKNKKTYSDGNDSDSDYSNEKNIRKIHAKLPSHDDYSDSFDSCSDSDTDKKVHSNQRKKSSTHSQAQVKQNGKGCDSKKGSKGAWVSDVSGKAKSSVNSSNRERQESDRSYGSDSDSYTGSSYTTDSGSVTDVSPLNTPHTPIVGRGKGDTLLSKPPKSPMYKDSGSSSQRKSTRPTSGRSEETLEQDTDQMDLNLLMQAVLEMDREHNQEEKQKSIAKNRRVWFVPPKVKTKAAPQPQKNMSFNNDRVKTIDTENQRLMDNILRCAKQANEAKKKKASKPKPQPKLTPSAVNRNKEQRRIEQENQKMLNRLQSAKATKTLRRNDLMHDYDHHLIAGVSVATVHPLPSKTRTTKSPYDMDTSMGPPHTSLRSDSKSSLFGSGRVESGRPSSGKKLRPSSASTTMSSSSQQRPSSGKRTKPRPISAHTGLTKQAGKYELKTTGPDWEPGW